MPWLPTQSGIKPEFKPKKRHSEVTRGRWSFAVGMLSCAHLHSSAVPLLPPSAVLFFQRLESPLSLTQPSGAPFRVALFYVLMCWTSSFLGAHFPASRISTVTIPFPDRMTSVFFSPGGECRVQRSGQLTLQSPFLTFPWTTCGPYTCILDHLPPPHLHSPGPLAAFTPYSPGPPAAVLPPGSLGVTLAPDPVLWALGLDLNGKHWSSWGRALIQPGWPSFPPHYLLAVLQGDVGLALSPGRTPSIALGTPCRTRVSLCSLPSRDWKVLGLDVGPSSCASEAL